MPVAPPQNNSSLLDLTRAIEKTLDRYVALIDDMVTEMLIRYEQKGCIELGSRN